MTRNDVAEKIADILLNLQPNYKSGSYHDRLMDAREVLTELEKFVTIIEKQQIEPKFTTSSEGY